MKHYCIAISGKSGCGNTSVSKEVARKLGFKHINYTFKQMADEIEIPIKQLLQNAKKDSKWDIELDRHQVQLAKMENSVVGSRLAIWLLKSNAFTVYLDAPIEIRAARVIKRDGDSETIEQTKRRDSMDEDRFKAIYGYDINEYRFCNLHIDVSSISVDEISILIINEFKKHSNRK